MKSVSLAEKCVSGWRQRRNSYWLLAAGLLWLMAALYLGSAGSPLRGELEHYLSGEGAYELDFAEGAPTYVQTFRPLHRNVKEIGIVVDWTEEDVAAETDNAPDKDNAAELTAGAGMRTDNVSELAAGAGMGPDNVLELAAGMETKSAPGLAVDGGQAAVVLQIVEAGGAALKEIELDMPQLERGGYTDVLTELELRAGKDYELRLTSHMDAAWKPVLLVCSTEYKLAENRELAGEDMGRNAGGSMDRDAGEDMGRSTLEGTQLLTRYCYENALDMGIYCKALLLLLLAALGIAVGLPKNPWIRRAAAVVLLLAGPFVLGRRLELLLPTNVLLPHAMKWNIGLMYFFELLVLLATQSMRFPIVFCNLSLTFLYCANYFVHAYRGTYLKANELAAVRTAAEVVGKFRFEPDASMTMAFCILAVFVCWGMCVGGSGRGRVWTVKKRATTATAGGTEEDMSQAMAAGAGRTEGDMSQAMAAGAGRTEEDMSQAMTAGGTEEDMSQAMTAGGTEGDMSQAMAAGAGGTEKDKTKDAIAGRLLWHGVTLTAAVFLWFAAGHFLLDTDLLLNHGFSYYSGINQEYTYYFDGYLVGSMLNIKYNRIAPPEGYSVKRVEEILAAYQGTGGLAESQGTGGLEDPDNVENLENHARQNGTQEKLGELPHIILIMNESFSDLRVNGNLELSQENLGCYKALSENAIKGYVNASVLGGGTANSEFEVFTGCAMGFLPDAYYAYEQAVTGPMNSMISNLKNAGYTTYSMHPEKSTNWRRNVVYPWLGFENRLWKEDFAGAEVIHSGVSDAATFKKVEELYENRAEGERMFIFDLTMQNHGGYLKSNVERTVEAVNVDSEEADIYLSLVYESDRAFGELVDYFAVQEEKVVICMFGDHQPKFESEAFYEDIYRQTAGLSETDQKRNLYKTPFIIWANYDIEEADGLDIGMSYLGILLQQTAGVELTPFGHFLEEGMVEYPVITVNGYVAQDGSYSNWSGEGTEFLEYRMLQYNYLFDSDTVEWGYYTRERN